MRKVTHLDLMFLLAFVLVGCESIDQNPFNSFFVENDSLPLASLEAAQYVDIDWLERGEQPRLITAQTSELQDVFNALALQGYIFVGGSPFEGPYADMRLALRVAQTKRATLVVYASEYTDSRNVTSLVNTAANSVASGNSAISFDGAIPQIDISTRANATTFYSVPVTNTVDRYNQSANFFVQAKNNVGIAKVQKLNALLAMSLSFESTARPKVIEDACSKSVFIMENFNCSLETNRAKLVANQNVVPKEELENVRFFRAYRLQLNLEAKDFQKQLFGYDPDFDSIIELQEQAYKELDSIEEALWKRMENGEITIGEFYRNYYDAGRPFDESIESHYKRILVEHGNKF